MSKRIGIVLIVLIALMVGCSRSEKREPSGRANPQIAKTSATPSPELDMNVHKYNEVLQQAQRFLALQQTAREKHMRALDEWEAAHGEIDYDKPLPRQLAKLADASDSCLAKQVQSMKEAADLLKLVRSNSTFAKCYKEGEEAIADEEVPGLLKGTPAEHLRFIQRR